MRKAFFTITVFLAAMALRADAYELSVRQIGGKNYYVYTVRAGDTLQGLSERFGMTRGEILRFNPSAEDGLTNGQALIFPVGEYSETNDSAADKAADADKAAAATSGGATKLTEYTVQNNETIFGIAHRFGVTPEKIVELNPQASSGVRRGMVLKLAVPAPRAEQAATAKAANVAANASANAGNATAKAAETSEKARQRSQQPRVSGNVPVIAATSRTAASTAAETATNASISVENAIASTGKADEAMQTASKSAENAMASGETAAFSPENAFAGVSAGQQAAVAEPDTIRIVLALPLMSEAEKVSKTAGKYNEFYRGFLVGAQSVAGADADSATAVAPVSITAIDTSAEPFTSASVYGADIVIVGEDEAEIGHAARMAEDGTYIINVFNLRGEQYLSHPNVVHANIDQNRMFDRVLDFIAAQWPDYTPVILDREGSRGEKRGFVDALRRSAADRSLMPLDIPYSGQLAEEDLLSLSEGGKYIFVPTSGSLADFNHFAPAVKKLRDDAADPSRLVVFGYPDWIAFRGEPRSTLSKLEATYYSRFADIEGDADASGAIDAFAAWYGSAPSEGVPNQALLGYDTARYIISGIRAEGSASALLGSGTTYEGVQSAMRHEKASGAASGYINDAVFIISCSPDGTTKSTVK